MNFPEIKKFSEAVFDVYSIEALSDLLLGLGKQTVDRLVSQNMTPSAQVREVVLLAVREGWVPQLVMAVVAERGNTQPVKDFLTQHPDWDTTRNPPLAHPCDTLKVFGGKLFLGRADLRKYLKEMETATGKKLLFVRADKRKVGKTYSKDLVAFLSHYRQPSQVVYHDLDSDDYDPVKLAKKLGEKMGVDMSSVPDTASEQAARSNQELVSILIPGTPNPQPRVWWIILDGFRQKVLSEASRDFIDQLALRIRDRLDFRLLLLNYTYKPALEVWGFAYKENVKPLVEDELKEYLTHVHKSKHGADPTAEKLTEYLSDVNELYEQYKQERPEYAEDQLLINIAVSDVADSI
jgi:hypothetical protein